MAEKKNTYPFEDLIKDNNVVVTELPKKTQDLIAKFPSITDEDAKDAMDQKIYIQVSDFLEEKAKNTKDAADKTKHAEAKKKKEGVDISKADTAAVTETPEQKAEREKAAATPKTRSVFDTIYGRK